MNKILINIDSRQRNTLYYPNSNYFKLGNESESDVNFYNHLNFKNIDSISLSSIEIPNNFYVFTDSRFNNFFYVDCTIVNFDNYDIQYNIPNYLITPSYQSQILYGPSYIFISTGNYDPETLSNEINIKLNQLQYNIGYFEQGSIKFKIIDGLYTKYNPNILKLTFYNKSNTYSFKLNFDNLNNQYVSFGYMLGYRSLKYDLNITEVSNDFYLTIPQFDITLTQKEADAIIDIDGERYIFLKINDYGNLYLNHKTPIKVLGKIILNSSKENFIFINTNNYLYKSHKFLSPVNINKLEIELLDYNGNRLDNGNCDYSITLELVQIYDENVYNSIYKKQNLTYKNNNNLIINDDTNKKKKDKKKFGFEY